MPLSSGRRVFAAHILGALNCAAGDISTVQWAGADQDRVLLKNYEKEFDQYSQRRVDECSPEYGSKSDADHTELVVKIDSVYQEYTLKELQKLSRALHVAQLALRLCQVEEGCLLLPFPGALRDYFPLFNCCMIEHGLGQSWALKLRENLMNIQIIEFDEYSKHRVYEKSTTVWV